MENNIIKKYCLSNIIDLLVPVIPVTYSYYYEKLMIFDYLSFFELLGIIYLAFNIVAYVGTKANTVGGNLSKLFLVDVKTKLILKDSQFVQSCLHSTCGSPKMF